MKLWHEHYFSEVEPELYQLLEEDAEEKRMLLPKMDDENLIEYASSGVILDDVPQENVVLFRHTFPADQYLLLL